MPHTCHCPLVRGLFLSWEHANDEQEEWRVQGCRSNSIANNDVVHHDIQHPCPFGRDVDFSIPVDLDFMLDYFYAYVSLDMGAAWYFGLDWAGFE